LKNLRKDQEGYLSLQFMASFPKMKKLGADPNTIIEAMKDSTQLVLNAEKTHLKRKVPFVIPPKSPPNKSTAKPPAKQTISTLTSSAETPQVVNIIENKTIYASYIPKNSDKTSIQNIFGIYGTIKRIDIPTKKNGEIKELPLLNSKQKNKQRKQSKNLTTKKIIFSIKSE